MNGSHISKKVSAPLVELRDATILTGQGRVLFKELNLCLSHERVALIGRNGMGKSTLLQVLAGEGVLTSGSITLRCQPAMVGQICSTLGYKKVLTELSESTTKLNRDLMAAGLPSLRELRNQQSCSPGEMRKLLLLRQKLFQPELLLLDEPTQDLDRVGAEWLLSWLAPWPKGLIVATHDRRLLSQFRNYFIAAESGAKLFQGSYDQLIKTLELEYRRAECRYVQRVNRLIERERHITFIARRRRRKKQYGRVRELGRATPKVRLNQKRSYAQEKHGRMARIRQQRREALRTLTRGARRALKVELDFKVTFQPLEIQEILPIVAADSISFSIGERTILDGVSLSVAGDRVAITGSNGAGKTTLLKILVGDLTPQKGSATTDRSKIGLIEQGASNWMLTESLAEYLTIRLGVNSACIAKRMAALRFPLALANRPLCTLSPGERVRAALICLFSQDPLTPLIVVDEPTYALDPLGQQALTEALNQWTGGLLVASHDEQFLNSIRIERFLELP